MVIDVVCISLCRDLVNSRSSLDLIQIRYIRGATTLLDSLQVQVAASPRRQLRCGDTSTPRGLSCPLRVREPRPCGRRCPGGWPQRCRVDELGRRRCTTTTPSVGLRTPGSPRSRLNQSPLSLRASSSHPWVLWQLSRAMQGQRNRHRPTGTSMSHLTLRALARSDCAALLLPNHVPSLCLRVRHGCPCLPPSCHDRRRCLHPH